MHLEILEAVRTGFRLSLFTLLLSSFLIIVGTHPHAQAATRVWLFMPALPPTVAPAVQDRQRAAMAAVVHVLHDSKRLALADGPDAADVTVEVMGGTTRVFAEQTPRTAEMIVLTATAGLSRAAFRGLGSGAKKAAEQACAELLRWFDASRTAQHGQQ